MAQLSERTTKTVKITVRSTRSFNNTFTVLAANVSKGEELTLVTVTITEVTPDAGYKAQFEFLYTFTDLLNGENILTIKIVGEDPITRTTTYTVTKTPPHATIDTSTDQFPTVTDPVPADETTNVARSLQLEWTGTDPQSGSLTYDVYLEQREDTNLIARDQTADTYPATTTMKLDAGGLYAWKIIAKTTAGISEGVIWSFRIAKAPDIPNFADPVDKIVEVDPTNVTLRWDSSSPESNTLTYDVYFGVLFELSPLPVASAISSKSYTVGALESNTDYYWKIVVSDDKGNVVPGPKWKFSTGA